MLMRYAVLILLPLTGCYLHRIPVTDQVAQASTYRIVVQQHDGVELRGDAWAIDAHHLVTSGALCNGAENVAILTAGGVLPVLAHVHDRLCLLDAPESLRLGPSMVLARTWHAKSRHLSAIGSPMWSRWGVVGVVLALAPDGHVAVSAGRAELEAAARALGASPTIAPPLSDLDMDITCQGGAKATGTCSTFEPRDAEAW